MAPERISIGDHILVNRYVQMQGAGDIVIGQDAMIDPCALIWSMNHVFPGCDRPAAAQGY